MIDSTDIQLQRTATARGPFFRLAPVLATALLASCSPSQTSDAEKMTYGEPGKIYPPSVAEHLSVSSAQTVPGENSFTRAVNCAVAVRITREALAGSAFGMGAEGIAVLRQAESLFAERARAERQGKAQQAITSRMNEVSDEKGEQAQLALACIRSIA